MNKLLGIIVILSILLATDFVVKDYRGWIKKSSASDFSTCLLFSLPDSQCAVLGEEIIDGVYRIIGSEKCNSAKNTIKEAIEYCEEYVSDNNHYSPYLFR
jgi:hypothetical protein